MAEAKQYLTTDEHGVMHVGRTRVQFEGLIYRFLDGTSAEEIQRTYPSLRLEEVYGTITYYLANRAEADEYLRRQDAAWKAARAGQDQSPPPHVRRLREVMRSGIEAAR
jgi:uncharacterized protein (DUF433 family)